ncbi:MAG: hypothetical protein NDJ89_06620 [Oligoflexia bacterium]|nr:hypothetical protein [Oligoflexia bacterium]
MSFGHAKPAARVHQEGKTAAYQILDSESFTGVDFELMKAFLKKTDRNEGVIFAPVSPRVQA